MKKNCMVSLKNSTDDMIGSEEHRVPKELFSFSETKAAGGDIGRLGTMYRPPQQLYGGTLLQCFWLEHLFLYICSLVQKVGIFPTL